LVKSGFQGKEKVNIFLLIFKGIQGKIL